MVSFKARFASTSDGATEQDRPEPHRAELGQEREAFARAIAAPDATDHAKELAELARRLGRVEEAACWAWLAETPREARRSSRLPTLSKAAIPTADSLRLLAAESHEQPSIPRAAKRIPRFNDATGPSGIGFIHTSSGAESRPIPPLTMCGGVGLLDYDGDGLLDVYAVQGGTFPHGSVKSGDRLYRNLGEGRV